MIKFIFAVGFFLLASITFANPAEPTVVLRCSTNGFSLAEMRVESEDGGKKGTLVVQIEEEGDADAPSAPPLRLPILNSGLKDLMTDTSATLLAKKDESVTREGGAYYDSALLRVTEGKTRAFLAIHGNVYILHCY